MKYKVAFLGSAGSFSHLAVISFLKDEDLLLESFSSIADVFNAVSNSSAEYGLVPIENTNNGSIVETLDGFINYDDISILKEFYLSVHHNLMSDTDVFDTIFSKEEVFYQCKGFLNKNYKNVKLVPALSTSDAVMQAKKFNKAAIGSSLSSELFDIPIINKNIEDNKNNTTRFLLISKDSLTNNLNNKDVFTSKKNKTSIMFQIKHQPRSLSNVLNVLAKYDINFINIDKRPTLDKNWTYVFFLDIEYKSNAEMAFDEVLEHCEKFVVLGSYSDV